MMLQDSVQKTVPSRALFLAALVGFASLGSNVGWAQDITTSVETKDAAQNTDTQRGIEKSDIRRGMIHVGDTDGDGRADVAESSRQADLKKLADELVNNVRPPAGSSGQGNQPNTAKVDAGNALNALSENARLGDPIPDIDITIDQGAGRSEPQATGGN